MSSVSTTKRANPQVSASAHMAKGQSALRNRILANLRDCTAKPNHVFCPPVTGADVPDTSAMARAKAAI